MNVTKAGVRDFEQHNHVKRWSKEHNVTQRANRIKKLIRGAIKITHNAEIIDSVEMEQLSTDDVMLIAAFGVLVVATLAAIASKFGSAKKADKFEFDVDTEMCPMPTQKESKKAIKKTLKNIMAKNNAKTTLIA